MNKRCSERHPGSTKQGRGRFSKASSWRTISNDTLYSREDNPCHQDRRQKTKEADEVDCSLGTRLKGFVGMRVASLAYVYPYSRPAEAQHGYTRHLSHKQIPPSQPKQVHIQRRLFFVRRIKYNTNERWNLVNLLGPVSQMSHRCDSSKEKAYRSL